MNMHMHVRGHSFRRAAGFAARADGKGFGTKPPPAKRKSVKLPKGGTASSSPSDSALQQQGQLIETSGLDSKQDGDNPAADNWSSPAQRPSQQIMEVPTAVNDRILRRIFTFAGLPTFLGFALFPLFYWVKVVQKVDLPMGFVFVTQSFVFGGGLLGIWYGILSASWEEQREGSPLGFGEFKANLPVFLDKVRGRGS